MLAFRTLQGSYQETNPTNYILNSPKNAINESLLLKPINRRLQNTEKEHLIACVEYLDLY